VDTYDEGSYWWRFRRLLDLVKGGEQAWSFNENQPVVRRAFDALERQWAAELPQVEKDALVLREQSDHTAMADFLADYTESCAQQALEVLDHLVAQLSG
jgi:secernin